jgi:hypothetical protein
MRLRLERGKWYAAEFLGEGLIRSGHRYSSIRVDQIIPLKTGNRIFELQFLHANYPGGVQDKTYRLQTLHAGKDYPLTRSVGSGPVRFLLIYDIDAEWINQHFNFELNSSESAVAWLNKRFVSG